MQVEHWNSAVDGPLSEQAMRRKLEKQGYSVTRYTYPPGTVFPEHAHSIDKIDGVLSGRFRIVMEGRAVVLEAGESLTIPRGTVHSAEVIGNEPVVSLDAAKASPRPRSE